NFGFTLHKMLHKEARVMDRHQKSVPSEPSITCFHIPYPAHDHLGSNAPFSLDTTDFSSPSHSFHVLTVFYYHPLIMIFPFLQVLPSFNIYGYL
ncbi:hypothetical protein ACFXL6_004633, partial [Salmonella enterica subsp. enterica serovar Kentucky]